MSAVYQVSNNVYIFQSHATDRCSAESRLALGVIAATFCRDLLNSHKVFFFRLDLLDKNIDRQLFHSVLLVQPKVNSLISCPGR